MARSGSIPADELAAADLQAHPVWQFRTQAEGDPGVDESHVAPKAGALTLGTFGSHLVAATYDLSNGVRLPGSVQVDVLGQKVHFTPAVVYAQGKSVDPLAHDAEQRLSRITKTSKFAAFALGTCRCLSRRGAGSEWAHRTVNNRYRTCASISSRSSKVQPAAAVKVRPNPSLEWTHTGMALGPRGVVVHHPPRGPSAMPVRPAQLKR